MGDAIDANDLDALVRLVDAFCAAQEWTDLVGLRERARLALERGRQLWPAASYAEYRLALDAPAAIAALVLTEDAGRFALGPLSEVALLRTLGPTSRRTLRPVPSRRWRRTSGSSAVR